METEGINFLRDCFRRYDYLERFSLKELSIKDNIVLDCRWVVASGRSDLFYIVKKEISSELSLFSFRGPHFGEDNFLGRLDYQEVVGSKTVNFDFEYDGFKEAELEEELYARHRIVIAPSKGWLSYFDKRDDVLLKSKEIGRDEPSMFRRFFL